jgi:hypothetical protein
MLPEDCVLKANTCWSHIYVIFICEYLCAFSWFKKLTIIHLYEEVKLYTKCQEEMRFLRHWGPEKS